MFNQNCNLKFTKYNKIIFKPKNSGLKIILFET